MGKTTVLLLGLFTGFVSLVLQAVSIGSAFWFEGIAPREIKNYYTSNETILQEIPVLIKSRGLFSYCGYFYDANVSSTTPVPSISSNANFQDGATPLDGVVRCLTYDFIQTPNPELPGVGYYRTLYYMDRSAAALACIMMGLQLCGVLTSCQAAWTVITVLFTDCGTMFTFGGFFGFVSLLLVVASYNYEVNERPDIIPAPPDGYSIDFSWSFYLSWAALGLCVAAGVMFLMVARQWHLEEVWFKKSLEEEKKRMPQQRYSRSKLIPAF